MKRRDFLAGSAACSLAAWTGQALAQSGPLTKIIFPFGPAALPEGPRERSGSPRRNAGPTARSPDPTRRERHAPTWIRTRGLLLRRESLYPAELSGPLQAS